MKTQKHCLIFLCGEEYRNPCPDIIGMFKYELLNNKHYRGTCWGIGLNDEIGGRWIREG